jgi:hypothetical protein
MKTVTATLPDLPASALCAVRCALADLIGSYQDWLMQGKPNSFHDWESHLESIDELALEFNLQSEIPGDLA